MYIVWVARPHHIAGFNSINFDNGRGVRGSTELRVPHRCVRTSLLLFGSAHRTAASRRIELDHRIDVNRRKYY